MNRLHQLKETLLQNIADNQDYEELEFVLLDYNSKDGLEEWVKENLDQFLLNGRLQYYKTNEPSRFWHSHSKNLAFRLAKGDILCNINADHFTGEGFAAYINRCFNSERNIVLTTIDYYNSRPEYRPPKDVYGKVCVLKNDFLKVRGFDEQMINYGFEDWDFINRLEMIGVQRRFIDNAAFLNFIVHGQEERYSQSELTEALKFVYVHYISPAQSAILALYCNGIFNWGTLTDDSIENSDDYRNAYKQRNNRYNNSIKDNYLEKGRWSFLDDGCLLLVASNGTSNIFDVKGDSLKCKSQQQLFYLLHNDELVSTVGEFLAFFENRKIMEENVTNNTFEVNPGSFGRSYLINQEERVVN